MVDQLRTPALRRTSCGEKIRVYPLSCYVVKKGRVIADIRGLVHHRCLITVKGEINTSTAPLNFEGVLDLTFYEGLLFAKVTITTLEPSFSNTLTARVGTRKSAGIHERRMERTLTEAFKGKDLEEVLEGLPSQIDLNFKVKIPGDGEQTIQAQSHLDAIAQVWKPNQEESRTGRAFSPYGEQTFVVKQYLHKRFKKIATVIRCDP